jgi:hypothetical protein
MIIACRMMEKNDIRLFVCGEGREPIVRNMRNVSEKRDKESKSAPSDEEVYSYFPYRTGSFYRASPRTEVLGSFRQGDQVP